MRFVQHVGIDPAWPAFGFTEKGEEIALSEVEERFAAGTGEREGVYFKSPKDGARIWPWKHAGYYVDDAGNPIAPVGMPDQLRMSRAELLSLGMTDRELDVMHTRYFGRTPDGAALDPEAEDTPELQGLRRRYFDEAMGAAYDSTDAPRDHDGGASFDPAKPDHD